MSEAKNHGEANSCKPQFANHPHVGPAHIDPHGVFTKGDAMTMFRKVYVEVMTKYEKDGRILPVSITWEDGTKYPIDRVTDIRPAASLKAGGAGIRYTCRIRNRETYLFLEGNRWFVEGKA